MPSMRVRLAVIASVVLSFSTPSAQEAWMTPNENLVTDGIPGIPATIAEKAPSLLRLIGYLHVTPVRMGLVADLREHPWSSYHTYLAGGASSFGPSLRGEVGEACA